MVIQLVGWVAAAILLATISRQVYSQWRDGTSEGVSKWLFIGQVSASSGFVVYSWLLVNWVFVVTNALILVTALLGQWVFLRNRQKDRRTGIENAALCRPTPSADMSRSRGKVLIDGRRPPR